MNKDTTALKKTAAEIKSLGRLNLVFSSTSTGRVKPAHIPAVIFFPLKKPRID
jgi:hypothetical protein